MERKRSWLHEHLETFVVPRLGRVPKESSYPYFQKDEMSVIKNAWRSIKDSYKKSGCEVLVLPGRDVYIFEILARRENTPTLFIPECSRMTVQYIKVPKNSFVVDTGFIGTIPRTLKVQDFKLLSYRDNIGEVDKTTQIFPYMSGSRHLALKIETTPKYWKSGRILDGKVYQGLSDYDEFEKAAALTISIYKDSSPSFSVRSSFLRKKESDLWLMN